MYHHNRFLPPTIPPNPCNAPTTRWETRQHKLDQWQFSSRYPFHILKNFNLPRSFWCFFDNYLVPLIINFFCFSFKIQHRAQGHGSACWQFRPLAMRWCCVSALKKNRSNKTSNQHPMARSRRTGHWRRWRYVSFSIPKRILVYKLRRR